MFCKINFSESELDVKTQLNSSLLNIISFDELKCKVIGLSLTTLIQLANHISLNMLHLNSNFWFGISLFIRFLFRPVGFWYGRLHVVAMIVLNALQTFLLLNSVPEMSSYQYTVHIHVTGDNPLKVLCDSITQVFL